MPISARSSRHLARRARRSRSSRLAVDVEAIGLDADGDHFGAQLPEGFGRHLVGGAVGAIDDDAQARRGRSARQGALGEFDVAGWAPSTRLARPSPADGARRGAKIGIDQCLDLALDLVGELVAVRAEQLDAVVLIGVVRGRDHHAEIGAQRARQHGDGRRRHRAEQHHVHADRREAGDHGVLDHVAGEARILADHHPVAVVAAPEREARGLSDLQRQIRRDHAVRESANAVRPEIFARHCHLANRVLVAPRFARSIAKRPFRLVTYYDGT